MLCYFRFSFSLNRCYLSCVVINNSANLFLASGERSIRSNFKVYALLIGCILFVEKIFVNLELYCFNRQRKLIDKLVFSFLVLSFQLLRSCRHAYRSTVSQVPVTCDAD